MGVGGSIVIPGNLYEGSLVRGDGYLVGELKPESVRETKGLPNYFEDGELFAKIDGAYRMLDLCAEMYSDHRWHEYRRHENSSHDHERSTSWTQFHTYDEFEKAARTTPAKFRKFTENDVRLTDTDNAGNGVSFGVTGDYLDVSRALNGEPECFGIAEGGTVIQRFAHIRVIGDVPHFVHREQIDARNHRLCRLVEWLEHNHVRCWVEIVWSNECCHVELTVKRYQDIFDINEVAIAGSADFFRRAMFVLDEYSSSHEPGYGCAVRQHIGDFRDDDPDYVIGVGNGLSGVDYINAVFDGVERQIAGYETPRNEHIHILI